MKKLDYMEPEMEEVLFESEDVMTASSTDEIEEGDNGGGYGDLEGW